MPMGMMNEINRRRGIAQGYELDEKNRQIGEQNYQIDGLCQIIENHAAYIKRLKGNLNNLAIDLGVRDGDARSFALQASRIEALSNMSTIFNINLKRTKLSVGKAREIVLDVIAWTEYIQLTDMLLPDMIQTLKDVRDTEGSEALGGDKAIVDGIFSQFQVVQDMEKDPKKWVRERKIELKKTIKYASRKHIQPKEDSFDSLRACYPENVLQVRNPKNPKSRGLFNIGGNIIDKVTKYVV